MPFSYNYFKEDVKRWIVKRVPRTDRVLDVGPGQGTYSDLIRQYGYQMDCVEIWEPYIFQYNLNSKYDSVFLGNVLTFDTTDYQFLIMGDVLEHLSFEDAYNLISDIDEKNKKCLVAVPYLLEQGEYENNVHETHLQSDLTPDVMSKRYPSLKVIFSNDVYGYYANF